jgi:hypothetical protein
MEFAARRPATIVVSMIRTAIPRKSAKQEARRLGADRKLTYSRVVGSIDHCVYSG